MYGSVSHSFLNKFINGSCEQIKEEKLSLLKEEKEEIKPIKR